LLALTTAVADLAWDCKQELGVPVVFVIKTSSKTDSFARDHKQNQNVALVALKRRRVPRENDIQLAAQAFPQASLIGLDGNVQQPNTLQHFAGCPLE
jgi:hypothetical protein